MELKFLRYISRDVWPRCFNRTFMELKLKNTAAWR